MKRGSILLGVFSILSLLIGSGCVCKNSDGGCRGFGYEVHKSCVGCFSCAFYTDFGTSTMTTFNIAVEGKDYAPPQIEFFFQDGQGTFAFHMDCYESFTLTLDICIVQEGILIGRIFEKEFVCNVYKNEVDTESFETSFQYDVSKGNPYYIINNFEANKKEY